MTKKINLSKLTLIVSLFLLLSIIAPTTRKIVLFLTSNTMDYLPESLKESELLYSFEYSENKSGTLHAFKIDKNIADRIKKEGISYLQKDDDRFHGKCHGSRYNCKWRATPIDEDMRAYKGLRRGLHRELDVRVWLEMEGKNGYYFTAENGTIAIVVLPRLSLLLYATGH